MSRQQAWFGLRKIVAERHGYRCCYCGVPTAATIEHLIPRSDDGAHETDNLRPACPSCNSRRGAEPLEEWTARKGWQLPAPPPLPRRMEAMLKENFGTAAQTVATGSTNSRLVREDGIAICEVRAGRKDTWQRFVLGAEDHPRVIAAAYDFLRRHYAPESPTRARPGSRS